MPRELQDRRPSLDDFVADLAQAAYPVALRHSEAKGWLDLELDLWRAMAQTVQRWQQRAFVPRQ